MKRANYLPIKDGGRPPGSLGETQRRGVTQLFFVGQVPGHLHNVFGGANPGIIRQKRLDGLHRGWNSLVEVNEAQKTEVIPDSKVPKQ